MVKKSLGKIEIPVTDNKQYSDELFVFVDEKNYKEVIRGFCQETVISTLYGEEKVEANWVINYVSELERILLQIRLPFTIVQESYHIDPSFRDSYYKYFSNQHFDIKRFTKRLSFFSIQITEDDFFTTDDNKFKRIAESFMGACVINPIPTGLIGRTLFNPKFLIKREEMPAYIRLSKFKLHVLGKKIEVDAFPFRMQDGETMRCAEVTLLNILEYFSNSYPDYRTVYPSDILDSEKRYSHERVLPSRGVTYPILTKILSEFGFAPRLYSFSSIERFSLSKMNPEDELKRLLHYYIESGFPVALNLSPVGGNGSGHSVVCIGHGKIEASHVQKAIRNKWIPWKHREKCHPIINSADFFEDYIVIDDNQPIYQIKPFHKLSIYPDMRVEYIAVPLYKRMFLDASDAAAVVRSVLHHEHFGIDVWAGEFLKPKEDVVIRLFMASSRSFKEYRSNSLCNRIAREVYASIPMPRFIWICELYRMDDYFQSKAFGEIVIDATAALGTGHSVQNIILMHYPGVLCMRSPEQSKPEFEDMLELKNDELFEGYKKNLSIINPSE